MEWDPTIITVAVVVLGFVAGAPYIRSRRKSASIDYGTKALTLAKSENDALLTAMEGQERRCTEKLNALEQRIGEQERRHARDLGEANGRIGVLTDSFAKLIAIEVAEAVVEAVKREAARVIAEDIAKALREAADDK